VVLCLIVAMVIRTRQHRRLEHENERKIGVIERDGDCAGARDWGINWVRHESFPCVSAGWSLAGRGPQIRSPPRRYPRVANGADPRGAAPFLRLAPTG
jgi:hypothetical protein